MFITELGLAVWHGNTVFRAPSVTAYHKCPLLVTSPVFRAFWTDFGRSMTSNQFPSLPAVFRYLIMTFVDCGCISVSDGSVRRSGFELEPFVAIGGVDRTQVVQASFELYPVCPRFGRSLLSGSHFVCPCARLGRSDPHNTGVLRCQTDRALDRMMDHSLGETAVSRAVPTGGKNTITAALVTSASRPSQFIRHL